MLPKASYVVRTLWSPEEYAGAESGRVRTHYWVILARRFRSACLERMADWCGRHKLVLTGHCWEHAFPQSAHAGSLGYALYHTRQTLPARKVPLLGLSAAFVFAAQMINFPVAGGTSGHLVGGVLTVAIEVVGWAIAVSGVPGSNA